jgi:transposase InsO family protein
MRTQGLASRRRHRFVRTTDSVHPHPVASNVLARNFKPQRPNQVWATDITYVRTDEGWLFLAVVMDLFSRAVVGWAMRENLDRRLTLSALDMALSTRVLSAGLLHHSDQGCQYASGDYQRKLALHGIRCSMSRRGNCWDNAPVESFFGTLKTELVHHQRFVTRAQAKAALFQYIEGFYNRRRRHSALGYRSPAEHEYLAAKESIAA